MQEKRTENFMSRLARFIVDKRKAFYLVFIAAFLFSAAFVDKVEVNNDITSYLPPETVTRRGLTVMEEEFVTLGSANVMVSSITYDTASCLAEKLGNIPGVSDCLLYTSFHRCNRPRRMRRRRTPSSVSTWVLSGRRR